MIIPVQKERNKTIDIMKGIGIVLMVLVHGGGPYSHFINLFHMPIFFIISGYLFNPQRIKSERDVIEYIKRKLITLWIPFVVINVACICLHNSFVRIGIYTENPQIYEIAASGTNKVQSILSIKDITIILVKTLFFAYTSQLAAPTWFLRTLFCTSIVFSFVSYFENKFNKRYYVAFATIVFAGIISTILSLNKMVLQIGGSSLFPAYFSYGIGYFLKELNEKKRRIIFDSGLGLYVQMIISIVALLILNHFGSVALSTGQITNILYYFVVSISGYYLVYSLSTIVDQFHLLHLKDIFSYIGRHSISILLLHLLAFKIVSYAFVALSGSNKLYVAVFPSIQNITGLWIAYLFVGITVPLLLQYSWSKIKVKLIR